ncbi:YoaK family protein [Mycolicibacterium phlei]|uniref:YoaK family protein n=1 Tax=Mycolicibacterium phlei TaxID=1771 RepID=UPI00025ADD80|nr:YoaK family protein [Mycolicibacterium phlei]EID16851.1 hypothetical protein MPHLEI_05017 [Mycolicibacterium phlei RIVM601174]MBF4190784.1 hypothetical protein [Mycolicibacterium phlei]
MRTPATRTAPDLALTVTIILTFVTGIVDAVGFLVLDRVFTGNMTGNIVILGMGVAGADELPVFGPAVALAAFTAAAWVAGLALRRPRAQNPPGWHHRVTVLLGLGAAALGVLALLAVAVGDHPPPPVAAAMAAATAATMGSQAVVARALAVTDMTTVVVTSTLAGLAGETWTRKAGSPLLNRRLGAIVVIFAGALTGALLLRVHMAVPFAVAAALTAGVTWVGHRRLLPRVLQPVAA